MARRETARTRRGAEGAQAESELAAEACASTDTGCAGTARGRTAMLSGAPRRRTTRMSRTSVRADRQASASRLAKLLVT